MGESHFPELIRMAGRNKLDSKSICYGTDLQPIKWDGRAEVTQEGLIKSDGDFRHRYLFDIMKDLLVDNSHI